ncbi:MAG: YIP1 family protein [Elusimicrobiota bacterium]
MNQITDRIIKAAKLDPQLFKQVEGEPEAMSQAVVIIILSSLGAGIGSLSYVGIIGLIFGFLRAIISWLLWAFVVYIIGAKILPDTQTSSYHGKILRTLGFSASPGILRVFGIIPSLYEISFFAANIWMIASMSVAVKQVFDYESSWRAAGVSLVSRIIVLIFTLILGLIFAGFYFTQ